MDAESKFDSSLKVKLQSIVNTSDRVILNVAPMVSETQSVSYQSYQPVHAPGSTQIYTGTSSRIFTLQPVMLVSRTPEEATRNLYIVNLIRSWTKPYFGNSGELLGSPPDVLLLSAYSTNSKRGNINKVPVVLTNLSITYPNDIDYIPTKAGADMVNKPIIVGVSNLDDAPTNKYANIDGGVPFPVVMQLDVTLFETHAAYDYANKFNLQAYKEGRLDNF